MSQGIIGDEKIARTAKLDDEISESKSHTNVNHSNVTHFTHSNLTHSNSSHSNLTHSNLTHSNLTHSNLTHSNLTHSNLTHSNSTHSNSTHSNLTPNQSNNLNHIPQNSFEKSSKNPGIIENNSVSDLSLLSSQYTLAYVDEFNPHGLRRPTELEAKTLRRVLGRAPLYAYLICLTELAERASYYSTSNVLSNFIQRPLPAGSSTGAPISHSTSESAGALGLGITTASALKLLLTFLAYVVPLFGGFIADTKIGKLQAIWVGVFVGFFSHIFFIVAGIPQVIAEGHAIVPTILGILTLALSSGLIKPNLLPLLLDQLPLKTDAVKVLKSGELVIVDRQKSLQRMTLLFYWAINIGAFFQLATSYSARRVGFWLAFLVPMCLYFILPFVMWYLHPRLTKDSPQGSVLTNAYKILRVSFRKNWISRLKSGSFWDYARPSKMIERGDLFYKAASKNPISWDDQWVIDVKKTVDSCRIFVFFPIFHLADGGIGTAQNAQAGAMILNGVPNDLFENFNPLTIIVLIPILDNIVYPALRKYRIEFPPVWRIFLGFCLAATSQTVGAILQHFIYKTSPCGNHASTCSEVSGVNGWFEVILYVLQASGECFAVITAYELAYTRSPAHLKGLVMALFLFMYAISAAVGEALTATLVDPLLVGTFTGTAIAGYIVAIAFLVTFRNLGEKMEQERRESEKLERDGPKNGDRGQIP